MKRKFKHLGTDCPHTGSSHIKRSRQGMCKNCKNPRAVRSLPGWRPFAALREMVNGRDIKQSWDWGASPLLSA